MYSTGGEGRTLNTTALLATPPAVIIKGPLAAPKGTETWILVSDQLDTAAAIPLNVTVLELCVAPKREPFIVTVVPTAPEAGARLVMFGGRGCGTTTVES